MGRSADAGTVGGSADGGAVRRSATTSVCGPRIAGATAHLPAHVSGNEHPRPATGCYSYVYVRIRF